MKGYLKSDGIVAFDGSLPVLQAILPGKASDLRSAK